MLLMTSNTRSGGVGQGRASFSAPRQRAKRLDGRRSGGYSASQTLKGFVLLWFTPSNRRVYAEHPLNARFSSSSLIPFTFTHSNL